ncbi:hypothetical protein ABH912_003175 [Pseudomonas sp. BT76 TE3572]|uniref:Uncharacterized protein n=1 Tax=Pseudomonas mandelii PD30 TaxID=1419583 RepID=A0A059L269_9PSED|nr:hypothetical protein [Pseudomonas mandelii]KDD68094.1 hypothetical protein V466_16365 [Pseudomonas mandelii PD30]
MSNDKNNFAAPIAKDVHQNAFYMYRLHEKETTPLTLPLAAYPVPATLVFVAKMEGTDPVKKWESPPMPSGADNIAHLPVSFLRENLHREVDITFNVDGVDSKSLKVRILP